MRWGRIEAASRFDVDDAPSSHHDTARVHAAQRGRDDGGGPEDTLHEA